MSEGSRTGVLLLAFGGPDSLDAVGPFMAELMGREPSPELVQRVTHRYLAIGGSSPLPRTARAIANALEELLSTEERLVPVRVGMRYWHPYVAEGMRELVDLGCTRIITVSLSPFETPVATGAYDEAVARAAEAFDSLEVTAAASYRDRDDFLNLLAIMCTSGLADAPKGRRLLAFTAHSLPEDEAGDEYVAQLRNVVSAIGDRLGLVPASGEVEVVPGVRAFGANEDYPWLLAYQSKGARPGKWFGPDIDDVLGAAKKAGFEVLVVCPIAFLTDHMETLYDLDIVLAGAALDRDMEFVRAPVPNDHPAMVQTLAATVEPLL